MKVFSVFLLMLFLAILFNMLMDFFLKLTLSESLENLMNPFWVMETGEYFVLVFLILLTIIQQLLPIIIEKVKSKKKRSA